MTPSLRTRRISSHCWSDDDEYHDAAVRVANAFTGRLLTTEWVLVELGNLLSRPPDRQTFIQVMSGLRADPGFVVLAATHESYAAGELLYAERHDKNWSLTDCISFAVMRERGMAHALSTDRHFKQAGFRMLLESV